MIIFSDLLDDKKKWKQGCNNLKLKKDEIMKNKNRILATNQQFWELLT